MSPRKGGASGGSSGSTPQQPKPKGGHVKQQQGKGQGKKGGS